MNVMDPQEVLRLRLDELRREHRALDEALAALTAASTAAAALEVRRLKKRKLALRDLIGRIEDRIIPDIIA